MSIDKSAQILFKADALIARELNAMLDYMKSNQFLHSSPPSFQN